MVPNLFKVGWSRGICKIGGHQNPGRWLGPDRCKLARGFGRGPSWRFGPLAAPLRRETVSCLDLEACTDEPEGNVSV